MAGVGGGSSVADNATVHPGTAEGVWTMTMKTLRRETSSRRQLWAASLLFTTLMLGMALRLYRLDSKNLGVDEILTAIISQQDVTSILQTHMQHAANPPLVSLLTHFFFACWGHSEFIARLPAALFGSLSILLAYKVGETLWTRDIGIIGAFLLAVNAYHVRYSQVGRYYALMVFLALLSLIFLLKALQQDNRILWTGFVLCSSLSLYNHYFAFLFLPAAVAFAAWVIAQNWLSYRSGSGLVAATRPSRGAPTPAKQALTLLISLILVAVSYLPWISTLQAQFPKQAASGSLVPSIATLQRGLTFLTEVLLTYSGAPGALVVVSLALFLLGLATSERKRILLVLLWVGIPFAFLCFVDSRHPLRPKYLLFILPVYLLVVARGIASMTRLLERYLSRGKRDPHRALAVVSWLVILVLGASSAVPLAAHYARQKEDWRPAVAYLQENMAQGDVIIGDGQAYGKGGDAARVINALTYYFDLPELGCPHVWRFLDGASRPLSSTVCTQDPMIFPAQRGLADSVYGLADPGPGLWGVLFHHSELRNLKRVGGDVQILRFPRVAVIRLLEPRGDVLEQTVSLLETLVLIQPTAKGRFDLHLALADVLLRGGRLEQAALQLHLASQVKPNKPDASRHLADAQAALQILSYPGDESIEHPLKRRLSDIIAFGGYTIGRSNIQASDILHVTLWWQALDKMDRDYSVFIHIVDQEDRIWSQHDELLVHGDDPTSTWLPGDTVKGEHDLQLPPDTPPGEYTVKTGIYYWETGERLPVWDENQRRLTDDAIRLGVVTVAD